MSINHYSVGTIIYNYVTLCDISHLSTYRELNNSRIQAKGDVNNKQFSVESILYYF